MSPTMFVDFFDNFGPVTPPMSPLPTIQPEIDLLTEDVMMLQEKTGFEEPDMYPDIDDIDFDLNNLNFDLDLMDAMMDESVCSPLIDNLQDTEPLRHDCMWGGMGQNKRKNSFTIPDMMEAKRATTDSNRNKGLTNLSTSPLISSSSFLFNHFSQELSCLDDPIDTEEVTETSDEVTKTSDALSDEDEVTKTPDTLSDDDDIDVESVAGDTKSMQIIPGDDDVIVVRNSKNFTEVVIEDCDNIHTDHSYFVTDFSKNTSSPNILTKKSCGLNILTKNTSTYNSQNILSKKTFNHKNTYSLDLLTPPQSEEDDESSDGSYSNKRIVKNFTQHYIISKDNKKRKKLRENQSLIKKSSPKFIQTLRFRDTVGCEKKSLNKQKSDAAESERKRRIDISKSFDLVKDSVPSIAKCEKVSKLTILNEALDYCNSLTVKSAKLKKEKLNARNKNELLKKKLRKLQLQAAQVQL